MTNDLPHETCGTFHELRQLFIFTGATAGLIGFLIVLVNCPILFGVINAVLRQEKSFRHFLYKILVCITFSEVYWPLQLLFHFVFENYAK